MTVKNLQSNDAITKLKSLAESIDFTMLCTNLTAKPFHAIPMSTKRVDDDGAIWFLSGRDSQHNENIAYDSSVELLYSHPGTMQFLSIFGRATIHRDKPTIKSLYESSDDAWFNGLDDPNISAIKVVPVQAHYWDTKSNRLIALIKMGVAALTGEKADVSVTGNLRV